MKINNEYPPLATLHLGDCLDVLRGIPDNSVDSVVTDPPYGLSDHKPTDVVDCLTAWLAGEEYCPHKRGFMGRTWDSWVPGPEVWREVFRVLKPGGHIVAFAGSRTHDLMSMALRLAGFECRDTVMWVYGSGFPKSMDVSKAIDKAAGRIGQSTVDLKQRLIALVDASGKTRAAIDAECGFRATNYLTLPAEGKRPDPWVGCLPTADKWETMKRVLGAGNDLDAVFAEAEREVIGTKKVAPGVAFSSEGPNELDITAPATDAARQWQGYGTALKPAFEPALLFRKPLIGNVAENVLVHGTGALNIDGCRVPTDDSLGGGRLSGPTSMSSTCGGNEWDRPWMNDESKRAEYAARTAEKVGKAQELGRWPANLIHDGSAEVVAAFPRAKAGSAVSGDESRTGGDGSAARFFYCAKASKKDRDAGLAEFDDQITDVHARHCSRRMGEIVRADGNPPAVGKNTHPTVKPTDLMTYLCRLVTPAYGVVLDPFMGSGSTGKAALREGFYFIGIEREAEYMDIAAARIRHECECDEDVEVIDSSFVGRIKAIPYADYEVADLVQALADMPEYHAGFVTAGAKVTAADDGIGNVLTVTGEVFGRWLKRFVDDNGADAIQDFFDADLSDAVLDLLDAVTDNRDVKPDEGDLLLHAFSGESYVVVATELKAAKTTRRFAK